MEHFIGLGPYACMRVELLALTPTGPYRLTVEHSSKRLIEYFETPTAVLVRQAETEASMTGQSLGSC